MQSTRPHPETGRHCYYRPKTIGFVHAIYDRGRSSFYPLSLPIEQRYGGFREDEFESLTEAFDLVALARNPRVLRA